MNLIWVHFMKNSLWKMFSDLLEKKTKEFPLILTRVHFTKNSLGIFFTGKSLYFFSQLRNLKLNFIPIKKLFHQNSKIAKIYLSWTSSVLSYRKTKEPFCARSVMGSFYKEFPCNFFLQGNPFTFFPNFEIWNWISFP